MTVRVHYKLMCNGGFTERCRKSARCEGHLVLEDGNKDFRGQAEAAGWGWVVQGYGDVQLCPRCRALNGLG